MSTITISYARVSTTKQGTDGDSPEAQKEQAERFAQNKGATIKKFFVFLGNFRCIMFLDGRRAQSVGRF